MSAGEVVGLALIAVLVGGACGALLVARWHAAARRAAVEERRTDAAIRWLESHGQRCRASITLVKAFRSLAAEPRDSPVFAERRKMARKAQRRWRRARRAHLRAETEMMAWSRDPAGADAAVREFPDDREIQRVALRGTQPEADALFGRIKEADRRAMEWVREDRSASACTPRLWCSLARWAEGMVMRVVRSWDRPD